MILRDKTVLIRRESIHLFISDSTSNRQISIYPHKQMERFSFLSLNDSLGKGDVLLSRLSLSDEVEQRCRQQQQHCHFHNHDQQRQQYHKRQKQQRYADEDILMNEAPAEELSSMCILDDHMDDINPISHHRQTNASIIIAEELHTEEINPEDNEDDDEHSQPTFIVEKVSDLVSPTSLGAKFATISYNREYKCKKQRKSRLAEEIYNTNVLSGIQGYGPTNLKNRDAIVELPNDEQEHEFEYGRNQLRLPQFTIHHHHYYSNSLYNNQDSHSTDQYDRQRQSVSSKSKQMMPYLPQPWTCNSSPNLKTPYLISSYLQLLIKFMASTYGLSLTYGIIQTVKYEIESKLHKQISESLFDIELCKREFLANNCHPDTVVPALIQRCGEWENCMNGNPHLDVSYTKMSGEILGSLVNSVFEPIGFKSFGFFIGLGVVCYLVNFGCGFVRAKSYYGWNQVFVNEENSNVIKNQNHGMILITNKMPVGDGQLATTNNAGYI